MYTFSENEGKDGRGGKEWYLSCMGTVLLAIDAAKGTKTMW